VTVLCFIDTETTGLDARIHQPYEVCWWRDDETEPRTYWIEHTLEHADQQALKIGRYWERNGTGAMPGGYFQTAGPRWLALALEGVTLVGSNPAFDAAMLARVIGAPVWHHRMIDVSNVAMVVFNTDMPEGLATVAQRLRDEGFDIPEPDHTAEGDVRVTRAAYEALRSIRNDWQEN
jgi:DNA polymerase-3 subunit epsilon